MIGLGEVVQLGLESGLTRQELFNNLLLGDELLLNIQDLSGQGRTLLLVIGVIQPLTTEVQDLAGLVGRGTGQL